MIDPKLQSLYDYQVQMAKENFIVVFNIPKDFNSKIDVNVNSDGSAVCVSIAEKLPLLKGKLFGKTHRNRIYCYF